MFHVYCIAFHVAVPIDLLLVQYINDPNGKRQIIMAAATPTKEDSQKASNPVSYEKFAPRTPAQLERLARIAELTAGPPPMPLKEGCSIPEAMSFPPDKQRFSTIEDPIVSSALRKVTDLTDQLTQQFKHTQSLKLALRATINISEDLSNRHAELIRHSSELSAAADRLQEEEAILSRHAKDIGKPLEHYDAVDRIGVQVGVLFKGSHVVKGLAKTKVDNEEEFPALLDEIDNAIDFFGQECGGKEALQEEMKRRASSSATKNEALGGNIEYFRRALLLQEAALGLIKEAVADRIVNITAQINSALQTQKRVVNADQLEASLIYTRYHGISSRSNRLLGLVRDRMHRAEAYPELMQKCRQTFCAQRESLLLPTVRSHMEKLTAQHGSVGMTRLASVFLIRFCSVETALFADFFGDKTAEKDSQTTSSSVASTGKDPVFQAYLRTMCASLHRVVRRSLVTMHDLDTLCQMVGVLREERSQASSSAMTMAAARGISNVIEDAQERLIFCSNATLAKEVVRFKAAPNDLSYPEKLEKQTSGEEKSKANVDEMERKLELVYQSWYPPVRSVLKILSKIFRVVEPSVFEDMALQSVQACTKCLRSAGVYIKQRKGILHADLFLVKHLLILREQLSPFDIELRSVEKQLDFSDAGKAMARFLANRNRRIFSMNASENALFTLLREGVSVQEATVDSKRDLEDALRTACNEFIENTSTKVAPELIATAETVKSQASAVEPESIGKVLKKTSETIPEEMMNVTSQMSLYLDNPGTQSILLKPVSKRIVRAAEELRKAVASVDDTDGKWGNAKTELEELLSGIESKMKELARGSSNSQ